MPYSGKTIEGVHVKVTRAMRHAAGEQILNDKKLAYISAIKDVLLSVLPC